MASLKLLHKKLSNRVIDVENNPIYTTNTKLNYLIA
jgi:hypothetical protein